MDEGYLTRTRIGKMEKIIEKLEKLRDKYARTMEKCNRVCAITNGLSIAMAACATASGSTVLATGMLPIGIIALTCSTICGVSSGINKWVTKKGKKYSTLTRLRYNA